VAGEEAHVPEQDPELLALFRSEPDAFWARVGEGCAPNVLKAVREACEVKPGGYCSLSLAGKHIGDGGAEALGRALESLPRPLPYTDIDVPHNGLGPAGVRAVARGVRRGYGGGGGGLEMLDLSSNPWAHDPEAVRAVAEALPPTLEELDVKFAGLGDAGLGALLPALAALPRLGTLHLSNSGLGPAGFAALAEALPRLGALTRLWVMYNKGAGSAGVAALAAGLPSAPALKHVYLSGCGADEATQAAFEAIAEGLSIEADFD
jgi:hypothetical protein